LGQSIIVLGDKTSHGGTVISCAPTSDGYGKGMARMGDMVACPRCKGVFPISQGDRSFIVDGQAVAYHGCRIACGASLIGSQPLATTEPSFGPSLGAGIDTTDESSPVMPSGFGSIGSGMVASYQDEPLDDAGARFRGRFQVLDLTSGDPVAEQQARVRSTGGQNVAGTTDAEGFTPWIERDAGEALAFDLIEPEQA